MVSESRAAVRTPVDDYADLGTLVPRVYLLTRLLMDVGHDPKGL